MSQKKSSKEFRNTPFKGLKGVSVSQPAAAEPPPPKPETTARESESDFLEEMCQLGVKPMPRRGVAAADRPAVAPAGTVDSGGNENEQELFLQALGKLEARFQDELPEEETLPAARPKRQKQLQRGRLKPEAELDLHGLTRDEAIEKVGHFLDNAAFHQLQLVLIVTGKGSHSEEGPVLRSAVETWLQQAVGTVVAEWCRAPREYGGEGALAVFLRPQRG